MRDSKRASVAALIALILIAISAPAQAEDGCRLWLRYDPLPAPLRQRYASAATEIVVQSNGSVAQSAASELQRGLSGLLARSLPARAAVDRDGAIVARLEKIPDIGNEGFAIRSTRLAGHAVTVVAANTERGLLYGSFALLRLMQTHRPIDRLNVTDRPNLALRMLDHWDNLDRTVERGYAGPSLWDWQALPDVKDARYTDYARASASVGINGAVLNNVNASAEILTEPYLEKVRALADQFRPWGVRVYLSARFTAPIEIGGLKTADPLNPAVRSWWKAKADEIYARIPDFGGFLVKANSEGVPGPQRYGRNHADGANMLADALRPHGGVVLWRAFVYSAVDEDRAKQAYDEFKPLDGRLADNVILQVKNGPIDFQPREPFHPLFGQMKRTNVAMEVQLTREYLGQRSGIVFLAPMWAETLGADTCSPRCGKPVRRTIMAMAGVANIGSDRNWTGNQFDQANWYAFGRLAWNPAVSPATIADEWTRMTWGNGPRLVRPVVSTMERSREAVVDFMTPLGLVHQMGTDHHYGPAPWVCDLAEPSWNPCYYSRADSGGIGFERASGSEAAAQYGPGIALCFADLSCIPDKYLLWFHHVPWSYRLKSGRTLWAELVVRYDRGVASVDAAKRAWHLLRPFVDSRRHAEVAAALDRERVEARWWRGASIAYWQSLSHLPLPKGHAPPSHPLSWYQAIHFDTVSGYLQPGTGRQLSCVPPEGGPPCAL
jgi:alpha-glucuronidase